MKVKVLTIRLIHKDKPLKAFADVEIFDGFVIRDFRITKQDGQSLSVEAPQTSWVDRETKQLKFKSILLIPSEERQSFVIAILSAYQKKLEEEDREKKQGPQR
jgi:DNA-binding cell septation regulator SpoVG